MTETSSKKNILITWLILSTIWVYQLFIKSIKLLWPPRWSSDQSSWLQIRRPGFDSRHYQKKKVMGLERGPLSLMTTTEELLDRKVATRRDPSLWPRGTLYPQKLAITSPASGCRSVGIVRSRTQTMELVIKLLWSIFVPVFVFYFREQLIGREVCRSGWGCFHITKLKSIHCLAATLSCHIAGLFLVSSYTRKEVTKMFSEGFEFDCRRLQRQLTDAQSFLSFAFRLRLFTVSSCKSFSASFSRLSVCFYTFLIPFSFLLTTVRSILITCTDRSQLSLLISASK
jgi:hypothetical protein